MNINRYKNIVHNKNYFLTNSYLFHAPFSISNNNNNKKSFTVWYARKYIIAPYISEYKPRIIYTNVLLNKFNIYNNNVDKSGIYR
jgi:hypothetical protein